MNNEHVGIHRFFVGPLLKKAFLVIITIKYYVRLVVRQPKLQFRIAEYGIVENIDTYFHTNASLFFQRKKIMFPVKLKMFQTHNLNKTSRYVF